MRKTLFLFFLIWVRIYPLWAQVITTDPSLPTAGQNLTITFDLKKASDGRALNLLGKKDDVFLWSGAGTTDSGPAFEYQPSGQNDFSKPFEPGKMTYLGNDLWSITINPRKYFNVPDSKPIRKLGLLLKSGDGKAQTEDLFLTLLEENKLYVSFSKPVTKSLYIDGNSSILFEGNTSQTAKLKFDFLWTDKKTGILSRKTIGIPDSAKVFSQNITVFRELGQIVEGTQITVRITAVNRLNETAYDEIMLTVKPTNQILTVPEGLKDGINYISDSKVILVLFAPLKEFIYVIGDFNDWKMDSKFLMNKTPDGKRFWIEISNLIKGQEYAYQYLIDGNITVGDPYAEKILDPDNDKYIPETTYPNLKKLPANVKSIASILQTGQTAYSWKVNNFVRPKQDNLIIYELLVRDFVADQRYKTVTDTLPYLKKLGINCIELMPVMEFTGNDSWGYNPVFYFAPDKAYGTKNDLKQFIDKCHENGIAVVLDMVLNQADYEFPYVKMYWDGSKPSADSPFFNQVAPHPFSVFFDFNHESQATKDYVQRVNDFWLKEYRFDGFRFDLAKGFTQKTSSDDGFFRLYDQSRINIWKNYYDKIRATDASAYVILELFSEDKEEQVLTDYGMMVWGNLNGDYRSAAKGYNGDFSRMSYKSRGFRNPNLVGYMESHDEERLMFDALKNGQTTQNYDARNLTNALEKMKSNAVFFLGVPGPKMIWQFGELGYDVSIDENGRTGRKPLRWEYTKDPQRAKLYKVFAALNNLKLSQPAFNTTDFELSLSGFQKQIILNHASMKVSIVGNFDLEDRSFSNVFPSAGKWYDYFTGTEIPVDNTGIRFIFKPGEFHILTTQPLAKPESDLVPWKALQALVTGIEEEKEQQIKVFPNPVSDYLNISFPEKTAGNLEISILDLTGKLYMESSIKIDKQGESLKLDIKKLPLGNYLLNVATDHSHGVIKFNKQ